jgi:hypothetical protein
LQNLVLRNEWHEYKTGSVWGWVPIEGGGQKERVRREVNMAKVLCTYEWK